MCVCDDTHVALLQAIHVPGDVQVDHVACGSAHTVVWSSMRRKVVCALPSRVPMEFDLLKNIAMHVLRNRLILLHHFSSLFCKSLTLFGVQSSPEANLQGATVIEGFDHLRSILMSSAKVIINNNFKSHVIYDPLFL